LSSWWWQNGHLIAHGRRLSVPAGTLLIEEGEPIEVLYVVLDGLLAVTLRAAHDEEIARLQSGEILGELSFLDSRPPSASVRALEPSSVLSIPRAKLAAKLEQDKPFAARFYRALGVFLASRLRRAQQRFGYGKEAAGPPAEAADELDPALLDHLALAGARFDWMLKRLRQAPDEPPPRG